MIGARDRTGRLLVVAFQGSLSPQVRRAVEMLRSGELGPVRSISGMLWQNWGGMFAEAWRSRPEISGGGFLFDTGAHMLNTVCDLAGEDFAVISAILDNKGGPVEVNAVIMGRLRSGALVTINACGDTTRSCASDVRVFCSEGRSPDHRLGRFTGDHAAAAAGLAPYRIEPGRGMGARRREGDPGRVGGIPLRP